MVVSAVSVVPSHDNPSWALLWYCWTAASLSRSRIALAVPLTESEGRFRVRPEDSCSCSVAIRDRFVCSEDSERWLIMCWVTRVMAISASVLSG